MASAERQWASEQARKFAPALRQASREFFGWTGLTVGFASGLEIDPDRQDSLVAIQSGVPLLFATTPEISEPQPIISVTAYYNDLVHDYNEDRRKAIILNPKNKKPVVLFEVTNSHFERKVSQAEGVKFFLLRDVVEGIPQLEPYPAPTVGPIDEQNGR